MSMTELQPATSKSGRHRFQYSLRALFGLAFGIAAFFSLARTLGYVDAVVIVAGTVVVVGIIMEYPRRVHLATGILLVVVAGLLLWANLRATGLQKEFNGLPPEQLELGPVATSMFYRGWPVSPCTVCKTGGGMPHPQDAVVRFALVIDGVVFSVALLVARRVCELCFRWRAKMAIKMPHGKSHPPCSPPAGSTSGPRVE